MLIKKNIENRIALIKPVRKYSELYSRTSITVHIFYLFIIIIQYNYTVMSYCLIYLVENSWGAELWLIKNRCAQ